MKYLSFLTFILIVLISGCTPGKALESTQVAQQGNVDPAAAKLAEAAQSISKSLLDLAEIQQATTPAPDTYAPPDPATYGMADLVSIDWGGPVEPLLTQIANATGYQVRTIGVEPAQPIMIFLSAKNKPIGNILRDVGFQSHKRANIVVFPNSKTIELRYAPTNDVA